ncbi:hypothetical protein DEO72_LG7g799 [Vigna unguiculata]|uniref:Uncharacterized protein n=1 Tax=Vigna unguiculata TaxID=3917 RepID=A0A4D6MET6_VIGUN|nr:hypothetical protein DEO72_LG7g799 [Vigna unguiculata]
MNLVVRVHGGASYNGHNFMNLLMRVHGDASYNGRNCMNLLVIVHGGASCNGHNSMTLLVGAHDGASGNGRNSTNLFSVLTQVVRVVGGPSVWQDNGLRCLKANLVRGRVKPIGNGSAEQ